MPEHGEKRQLVGWLCPACGSVMFHARALKGYPKTGPDAERRTCALHGPLGEFHHIATDRKTGGSDV